MSDKSLLKIIRIIDGKEVEVADIKGDQSQAKSVYDFLIDKGLVDIRIIQTHLLIKSKEVPVLLMPESLAKTDPENKLSILDFEKESLDFLKLIEPVELKNNLSNKTPKEFGKNKTKQKKWFNR